MVDYDDPSVSADERRRRREEANLNLQNKLNFLRSVHLVRHEQRDALPRTGSMLSDGSAMLGPGSAADLAQRVEDSITRLVERHTKAEKRLIAERDAARATAFALAGAIGPLTAKLKAVRPELDNAVASQRQAEDKARRMADHVRELQEQVRALAKGTIAGAVEDAEVGADEMVSHFTKKMEVEKQWDQAAESLRRVATAASAPQHSSLSALSRSADEAIDRVHDTATRQPAQHWSVDKALAVDKARDLIDPKRGVSRPSWWVSADQAAEQADLLQLLRAAENKIGAEERLERAQARASALSRPSATLAPPANPSSGEDF
jgi:hypothetical protein